MSDERDDGNIIDFSEYRKKAERRRKKEPEAGEPEKSVNEEIDAATPVEEASDACETGEPGEAETKSETERPEEAGTQSETGEPEEPITRVENEEPGEPDTQSETGGSEEAETKSETERPEEADTGSETEEPENDNTLIFPVQNKKKTETSGRSVKKVLKEAAQVVGLILIVAAIFAVALYARTVLDKKAENTNKENPATDSVSEEKSRYPWWDERDTTEGVNLATSGNAQGSSNGKVEAGDRILFGTYNQGENGEVEKISWIVLEAQEEYIIMTSEYLLDVMPYSTYGINRWEDSDIREWLNDGFYNQAFSSKEKEFLLRFEIENQSISMYNTESGQKTGEAVVLLSVEDMGYYFGGLDMKSRATPYAVEKGIKVADNGYSIYWLRSPGGMNLTEKTHGYAANVGSDGKLNTYGNDVTATVIGIRPVIIIKNNY